MTAREYLNRKMKLPPRIILAGILLVVLGGLELSKSKRSRLSEQTIDNLGIEEHVPAQVLLKLSPLVDKEMSRGQFERKLNKILSLNELLEYQKVILASFNSLPPLKQSGLIDLMPRVFMFIGILVVIVATTYLTTYVLVCPECRENLGRMILQESMFSVGRKFKFCPMCGLDLDQELPPGPEKRD